MDRWFDIAGVGDHNDMGRAFNIPWIGSLIPYG